MTPSLYERYIMRLRIYRLDGPSREFFQSLTTEPLSDDAKYIGVTEDGWSPLTDEEFKPGRYSIPQFLSMFYYDVEAPKV